MKLKLKLVEIVNRLLSGSQYEDKDETQEQTSQTVSQPPAANLPVSESQAVLVNNLTTEQEQEESNSERQQWDSPVEFLLSCISMSVGLGNVWRFPFTAYENGGGAFLIPYLIVLVLIGRPLYLLELSIGQFSSSGCVKIWDLAPGFRGIGYGQSLATFIVCCYYCALIGISCYYLFASMQAVLPWTVCHLELAEAGILCLPSNSNRSELNMTLHGENLTLVASSEQYFQKGVLKGISDISDGIGLPDPALAGCLVLCWFIIYLTLRKGVASSGKVAYFTAIFPYMVMLTMLVRGLMLPGAMEGIKFLFVPQWEKLYEPRVWYAAVTQSFFSMGVGFGSIITFSSYNKFNHNIYKDATIIAFADTFTSTLAGVITFSILGHLAYELDSPISDVIKSGTGLAFISYPEVVAKFEMAPQLFAVLFFLMLITLGLGSAVGMINVVITVLNDASPGLSKSVAAGLVCLAGAVVGIVFTTPGGQPLLELVDYYGGSMLILVMALLEVMVLTWVYGRGKLIKDMNFMMDRQLGVYWKFCWFYFIPVTLSCILAYTLVCYKPVEYAHAPLPLAAQISGWLIFLFGVMVVFAFMIKQFRKQHSAISENGQTWLKTIWSAAGSMLKPLDTYGPAIMGHRIKWLMLDDQENAGNINFAIEKESPMLEIHTISKTVEM